MYFPVRLPYVHHQKECVVVSRFNLLIGFQPMRSGWFESFHDSQSVGFSVTMNQYRTSSLSVCLFPYILMVSVKLTDTYYYLLIIILSYMSHIMCPDFIGRFIFEPFIWYIVHCTSIKKIGRKKDRFLPFPQKKVRINYNYFMVM